MPSLDPQERIHSFYEINLGYDSKTAMAEASRCLHCLNHPCVDGCPIHMNIPSFIKKIKEGDINKAYEIIDEISPLPRVCSRVCPQEKQCEGHCTLNIKNEAICIGALERYVTDNYQGSNSEVIIKNNHRIAIIGAGPAGIACASELLKLGYHVTIYDENEIPGGAMMYAIPEYRLPKKVVFSELNKLKDLGVQIETKTKLNVDITIEDLFNNGFDTVFIATGAYEHSKMNIKGENLPGVYNANEYLYDFNNELLNCGKNFPLGEGKTVAVIGGGNVAIDAATTALRLGAKKVSLIYRRSFKEIPARFDEINAAKQEGVEFILQTLPIEIIGKDKVEKIKCQKMELADEDEQARRRPVPIVGSEYEMPVDIVIIAIGSTSKKVIDVNIDNKGRIIVDSNNQTSMPNVYAGGDVVTGTKTIVSAIAQGKNAAKAIDEYVRRKK